MAARKKAQSENGFKKACDLRVVVKCETDESPEGKMRFQQARDIICHLIYLGMKKGRPSLKQEDLNEAA